MARRLRRINEFSLNWMNELFNGSEGFEAVKVGSNVIEVRMRKLDDLAFEEGGPIRLIANILVDSNGKVNLTSVVKKNQQICYRLSTSVR